METLQKSRTAKQKLSSAAFLLSAVVCGVTASMTVASANSIPTESMEPTLQVGDQVMVNKLDRTPQRGDIVVFKDAQDWMGNGGKSLMIKRVIGLPGDSVSCCGVGGSTIVNGKELEEPYALPELEDYRIDYTVSVPEGSLFVMGDNRPNSSDSRAHLDQGSEFISIEDVVGTAYAVRWPLNHIHLLPNPLAK